jgi:endonuclease-3
LAVKASLGKIPTRLKLLSQPSTKMKLLSPAEMHEAFSRWQAANPKPASELEYVNAYTLLVAVVLSAQATDKGVNKATGPLFKVADSPEKMLALGEEGLISYIKTIGLYKNKAKHVMGLSQKLLDDFGGEVPDTMEELLSLPGIGRKTANLLLGDLYHKEGVIIADTHFIRIMKRIGTTESTDPKKAEMEAREYIPPERSSDLCHRVVLFGRDICRARKTDCERCPLTDVCRAFVNKKFTIKD